MKNLLAPFTLIWGLILVTLIFFSTPVHAQVQIYAAASLAEALTEAAEIYEQQSRIKIIPVFAASSVLARQIRAGAPADIFISADERWMNYLENQQLIIPGSRKTLLRGRLVLITQKDNNHSLEITPHFPLAKALGRNRRLAVGDPDHVPAGRYAEQALRALDVWHELAPRLARAEDVRRALDYVARGSAPYGIVYETDALSEPRVKVIGAFPENTHEPIRYPIALVRQTKSMANRTEAKAFKTWLGSHQAKEIFKKHGFQTVEAK